MIRSFWNEEWKEIVFDEKISEKEKFKISNYGRIINCKGLKEFLVKDSYLNGYRFLALKQRESGKSTGRYLHKLVAEHFLEKKEGDEYVIHLDYDKSNNRADNLKWTTKEEKEQHQFSNPVRGQRHNNLSNAKLTETRVKLIKKMVNDPNRKTRMKMIAKRFGISEMQLYRIKSGENWGWVSEK